MRIAWRPALPAVLLCAALSACGASLPGTTSAGTGGAAGTGGTTSAGTGGAAGDGRDNLGGHGRGRGARRRHAGGHGRGSRSPRRGRSGGRGGHGRHDPHTGRWRHDRRTEQLWFRRGGGLAGEAEHVLSGRDRRTRADGQRPESGGARAGGVSGAGARRRRGRRRRGAHLLDGDGRPLGQRWVHHAVQSGRHERQDARPRGQGPTPPSRSSSISPAARCTGPIAKGCASCGPTSTARASRRW